MDNQRRKELKEQYKQIKTYMGVYKITNTVNGKIYIATSSNLKSRWFTICQQLDMGKFVNSQLQKDWKELGEKAFTYEVIEEKEVEESTDTRWELKQMEKEWHNKLQPYDDKGYNRPLK